MILHGDPLDQSMFWVGAMFAFTPVIVTGTVIAVWWRGRQRELARTRALDQASQGKV